jgi:hypothetical protein
MGWHEGATVAHARHIVLLAQVKIMKDWDPTGKRGPKVPLPDVVKVSAAGKSQLHIFRLISIAS